MQSPTQTPSIALPETSKGLIRVSGTNLKIYEMDPKNICEGLTVCKNFKELILSDTASIGTVIRSVENGPNIIRALLNILLTDLVLFFNVGKSMDKKQIFETRRLIMEEYHHLKPEDFKYCFDRAKKGHFGQIYDRIDGNLILSWIAKHDIERASEVEQIRDNENKLLKEASKVLVVEPEEKDEIFTRNFNKLKAILEENKAKREFENRTTNVTTAEVSKDPVAMMYQRWIKQFDNTRIKQSFKHGRFVKRYGKLLDVNEFLTYKQNQYSLVMERQKTA